MKEEVRNAGYYPTISISYIYKELQVKSKDIASRESVPL